MPRGKLELTWVGKDERPAPDALPVPLSSFLCPPSMVFIPLSSLLTPLLCLRLTSLLMQGQIRPHSDDSVAIDFPKALKDR